APPVPRPPVPNVVPRAVAPVALERIVSEPTRPLSPREREVAALIAHGCSNAEIARALVITEGTAANHVARVMRKLGVRSRTGIGVWAAERGLAGGSYPLGRRLSDVIPARSDGGPLPAPLPPTARRAEDNAAAETPGCAQDDTRNSRADDCEGASGGG